MVTHYAKTHLLITHYTFVLLFIYLITNINYSFPVSINTILCGWKLGNLKSSK